MNLRDVKYMMVTYTNDFHIWNEYMKNKSGQRNDNNGNN